MTQGEKSVLERVENKIDDLYLKLLDPDKGIYHRINENTRFRVSAQRLQWLIIAAVVALAVKVILSGG